MKTETFMAITASFLIVATSALADNVSTGDSARAGGSHLPGAAPMVNMDRGNAGNEGTRDDGALSRDKIPSRPSVSRPDMEDMSHSKDNRTTKQQNKEIQSGEHQSGDLTSDDRVGPDSSL